MFSSLFSFNKGPVKVATTNAEREKFDTLADLYAIIKTADFLEKAYIRDSCTLEESSLSSSLSLSRTLSLS